MVAGPHRIAFAVLALVLWTAAADAQPVPGARGTQDWVSTRGRDHPLAGRIWDVAGETFVTEAELLTRLRATPYVLLGDTHDNVDHHRLQARVVQGLAHAGCRPVVTFEQMDTSQQAPLDRWLMAPGDAAGIGRAVKWSTAWPDWRV